MRCAPGQRRAYIGLGPLDPGASVAQLEFFPYDSDLISVPAPQVWWSSASPGGVDRALAEGSALALCLAPPIPGLPVAGNGTDAQAVPTGGILVAGERAVELRFHPEGAMPVLGERLAEALPLVDPTRAAFSATGTGVSAATTAAAAGSAAPSDVALAAPSLAGWLAAIVGALAGGLILNLMPCVFPVIGLKVLSFAGEGRMATGAVDGRAVRGRALAFVFGVIASFVTLGLLMIALRALGSGIGWGFQLQSPTFVAALTLLFVAIGLNLAGVYEVGLTSMTWASSLGNDVSSSAPPSGPDRGAARGDGRWSAALSGALAVLVAAPCTAPFMAGAVGYTLAAPWWASLTVFVALGIGMALPYLLLVLRPALLDRLPRPGAWMETVRQVLAFPMFLTAAWLVWVLAQQAGPDAVLAMLAAAVVLAFALWVHGRAQRAGGGRVGWRLGRAVMIALALVTVAGLWWRAASSAPGADPAATAAAKAKGDVRLGQAGVAGWQPWSPERLAQAQASGRPVLVDFTAAWCISCQVNKKLVLDRDPVVEALSRRNVVLLQADWTRFNPQITAALASFGRSGVPLYLYYAPGAVQPAILPELLTVDAVLGAIGA